MYAIRSYYGLEIFKQNSKKIVAVITDIHMPKMDGSEMAREIKKISPHTPLIACTELENSTFDTKLFFTIVEKPLRYKELKSALLKTVALH